MADQVSDNMIRNFHAETGDSRRDEKIHILGLGGAELDGKNQIDALVACCFVSPRWLAL